MDRLQGRSGATVTGGTAGFAVADHDSAGNIYIVWADSSDYHTWLSVAARREARGCNQSIDDVAATADGEPTVDAGLLDAGAGRPRRGAHDRLPVGRRRRRARPRRRRVLRHRVRRRPELGRRSRARWNVYVNQSLNALDATRDVQPGEGDDASVPLRLDLPERARLRPRRPGGRPVARRLLRDRLQPGRRHGSRSSTTATTRSRTRSLGHVATPMVATQIAGPSRRRHRRDGRARRRPHVVDRPGRRRAVELLADAPAVAPPDPPTKNEPAADFTSASRSATDAATGGFTVTLKVASLSQASLLAGAHRHGSASRCSGSGASRTATRTRPRACAGTRCRASRSAGTTTRPAARRASASDERGRATSASSIRAASRSQGTVDQLTGTITLTVPRTLPARSSSGADARRAGRSRQPAAAGARFYDGTAFSFANNDRRDAGRAVVPLPARQHAGDGLPAALTHDIEGPGRPRAARARLIPQPSSTSPRIARQKGPRDRPLACRTRAHACAGRRRLVAAAAALLVPLSSSRAASPGAGPSPLRARPCPGRARRWSPNPTAAPARTTRCDNYKLTVDPGGARVKVRVTLEAGGRLGPDVFGPDGGLIGTSGNGPDRSSSSRSRTPSRGPTPSPRSPSRPQSAPTERATPRARRWCRWRRRCSRRPAATPITYRRTTRRRTGSAATPASRRSARTGRRGNTMFQAGLQALRVTWDDSVVARRTPTWTDVSFPTASAASLDPIGFMDQQTRAAGSARSSPARRASRRPPTTTARTGCRARAAR